MPTKRFRNPGPSIATMPITRTMNGKATTTSTIRMMTASSLPP